MFDLFILIIHLQYLLLFAILSLPLPFFLLHRFQTFLSWVLSHTGDSFLLFHILRSSSGLSLRHLNPFLLGCSVNRVLGILFPDISKLRDCATLIPL